MSGKHTDYYAARDAEDAARRDRDGWARGIADALLNGGPGPAGLDLQLELYAEARAKYEEARAASARAYQEAIAAEAP